MTPATKIAIALALALLAGGCTTDPAADRNGDDGGDVPADKQTTLGLYVTAAGAYDMWRTDPDHVHLLDIRTAGEYIYVGHAAAAHNVPHKFLAHTWNADTHKPVMTANRDFITEVRRRFRSSDLLLVCSRAGKRGAKAVNALAAAGFTNAYNIVDGFQGDKVTDPASPQRGKRTLNGWTNAGAPWTYDLDPDLMYLPDN